MNPTVPRVAALVALVHLACGPARSITVSISQQNGSGQDGSARLTEMGHQTQVTITLPAPADGSSQPAHVHEGNCPSPGAIAFVLEPLVGGSSTSLVDATLPQLQGNRYALNVHHSVADFTQFACGDIP